MDTYCPHCGTRLPDVRDAYCPECRQLLDESSPGGGAALPADGTAPAAPANEGDANGEHANERLRERIGWLEERVTQLEQRLRQSSVHSESFLARAFTIWGHWFVAYMLIALPVILLAMCGGMLNR